MPYFVPVERDNQRLIDNKKKIDLGRHLYYDQRLSSNGTISCNSCHDLKKQGTNGAFYLESKNKGATFRDVPTIYNVATLSMYNADGGITNFKQKLKHAFTNPYEMNVTDESLIVQRLGKIASYKTLFKSAFPNSSEAVSMDHIMDALQAFIEGLSTPAPIDSFIQGNDKALSKEEIEGGHIFNSKSCYSCHTGSNFGGQMIQKLGIAEAWPNKKDLGYYHLKKVSAYKMFFRVASLRNVEKTGPYFHDASSSKLWRAIKLMGRHERGLNISEEEALKIEIFLKSLSGEIPIDYIKKPKYLLN
ncbi:cytochrome-c peroxidase [Flavivirga spongiicola]